MSGINVLFIARVYHIAIRLRGHLTFTVGTLIG